MEPKSNKRKRGFTLFGTNLRNEEERKGYNDEVSQ